jgi:hypothetical protein
METFEATIVVNESFLCRVASVDCVRYGPEMVVSGRPAATNLRGPRK